MQAFHFTRRIPLGDAAALSARYGRNSWPMAPRLPREKPVISVSQPWRPATREGLSRAVGSQDPTDGGQIGHLPEIANPPLSHVCLLVVSGSLARAWPLSQGRESRYLVSSLQMADRGRWIPGPERWRADRTLAGNRYSPPLSRGRGIKGEGSFNHVPTPIRLLPADTCCESPWPANSC